MPGSPVAVSGTRRLREVALLSLFVCTTVMNVGAQGTAEVARDGRAIPIWRTDEIQFDSRRVTSNGAVIVMNVAGVTKLPDGTIVLADNGAYNLKFFHPDGRFLRAAGREGAGPGEYSTPRLLGTCGQNRVFVYDGALARITVLERDGSLVDTWRIGMTNSDRQPPMQVVCGVGRTAVLLGWPTDIMGRVTRPVAHRSEIKLNLRPMSRDALTTELGRIMGPDRQRWPTSDGPRPLGKQTYVAIGNDRLYVGTGDSLGIEVRSFSGAVTSLVRLPYNRIPIDDDYVADFVDRVIELNPNRSPASLRRRYAEIEFPKFFPTHGDVILDTRGNLWVERYRLPGETASRWTVFDHDGKAIGAIDLPDQFRLMWTDLSQVLGTFEDSTGELHILAYGIRR